MNIFCIFTMDSTPGTQTLVFWWFFDFYTLKSFFSAACTMQQGTRVQTNLLLRVRLFEGPRVITGTERGIWLEPASLPATYSIDQMENDYWCAHTTRAATGPTPRCISGDTCEISKDLARGEESQNTRPPAGGARGACELLLNSSSGPQQRHASRATAIYSTLGTRWTGERETKSRRPAPAPER